MRIAYRLLALTLVASAAVASAQQPAPAPPPGPSTRQGPLPQRGGARRSLAPTPGGPGMGQMGPGGPGMMGDMMGSMMGGMMGGGGIASMLLAHTAELKLTDPQLSRLAAIARRTDDRHKAMRASMDSLMPANHPQPGAAPVDPRPMMGDQHRAMMDRVREQERTEVRDALAVLTVDQQADAWMMRGARPMRAGGPPGAPLGGMRGRRSSE